MSKWWKIGIGGFCVLALIGAMSDPPKPDPKPTLKQQQAAYSKHLDRFLQIQKQSDTNYRNVMKTVQAGDPIAASAALTSGRKAQTSFNGKMRDLDASKDLSEKDRDKLDDARDTAAEAFTMRSYGMRTSAEYLDDQKPSQLVDAQAFFGDATIGLVRANATHAKVGVGLKVNVAKRMSS